MKSRRLIEARPQTPLWKGPAHASAAPTSAATQRRRAIWVPLTGGNGAGSGTGPRFKHQLAPLRNPVRSVAGDENLAKLPVGALRITAKRRSHPLPNTELVHPAGDPNPLWQATPPMACLSSSSGTALPLWH